MEKTTTFFISLIIVILTGMTLNAQILLNEQFDYPAGNSLTANTGTTFTIKTTAGSLSYAGYPALTGKKASLGTSEQDVNKSININTSGTIYATTLINITANQITGDYFIHLMKPGSTSPLGGRVNVSDATLTTQWTLFSPPYFIRCKG